MRQKEMERVAVLGAGVMGHSISLVFAQHGLSPILCDISEERLDHAFALMRSVLETLVEFGRLSEDRISDVLGRIEKTTDPAEAVRGADMVVEAVPEIEDIKKDLFSRIDAHCPKHAVVASNTSGLNIFELADTAFPERLIVAHWFSPPHIMPLVEVVPGKQTSAKVVSKTVDLLKSVGKTPIVLKEFAPGFIVNRFQNAMNRTAFEIIEKGLAGPEEIDLALKHTLGIKLPVAGVAQALDFTGLDLIRDVMRSFGLSSSFIDGKVEKGEFGVKTCKGIYDYPGRTETEILKQRDRLYFKMLDYLREINAFDPV